MSIDHTFMVMLAKSLGLFCFIGASVLVLYYALRPSAKARFEQVGRSILVDEAEDRPLTDRSSVNEEENGRRDRGRA